MPHVLRRLRTPGTLSRRSASSDSIWMVARASAVPRSAAAVLTVVAPAALVAPARKHHPADMSAGARWAATAPRSLLARSQRPCCGSSSRALGLAEVVRPTECSASAAVAAAPDDARRSILLAALSSRRRALVTLSEHCSSMCLAGANSGCDGGRRSAEQGKEKHVACRPCGAQEAQASRRRP